MQREGSPLFAPTIRQAPPNPRSTILRLNRAESAARGRSRIRLASLHDLFGVWPWARNSTLSSYQLEKVAKLRSTTLISLPGQIDRTETLQPAGQYSAAIRLYCRWHREEPPPRCHRHLEPIGSSPVRHP